MQQRSLLIYASLMVLLLVGGYVGFALTRSAGFVVVAAIGLIGFFAWPLLVSRNR